MKISHRGAQVFIDNAGMGPGTARSLAMLIEGRIAEVDDPKGKLLVRTGELQFMIANRRAALMMVSSLDRHAAAAEVVRGPVGGAIKSAADGMQQLDAILGDVATAVRESRPRAKD